jgi:hypothetical protein
MLRQARKEGDWTDCSTCNPPSSRRPTAHGYRGKKVRRSDGPSLSSEHDRRKTVKAYVSCIPAEDKTRQHTHNTHSLNLERRNIRAYEYGTYRSYKLACPPSAAPDPPNSRPQHSPLPY